ncbi:hypothetical protein ACOME3_000659 [Neoechinorhynchus agilis]
MCVFKAAFSLIVLFSVPPSIEGQSLATEHKYIPIADSIFVHDREFGEIRKELCFKNPGKGSCKIVPIKVMMREISGTISQSRTRGPDGRDICESLISVNADGGFKLENKKMTCNEYFDF